MISMLGELTKLKRIQHLLARLNLQLKQFDQSGGYETQIFEEVDEKGFSFQLRALSFW